MIIRLLAIILFLASHASLADTITGRVVKVYDGDTVTILGVHDTQHHIRLQGIVAPERGQAYGRKSGIYLADAVAG